MYASERYRSFKEYCRRIRKSVPDTLKSFAAQEVADLKLRGWLTLKGRLWKKGQLANWQIDLLKSSGFNGITNQKPPKKSQPATRSKAKPTVPKRKEKLTGEQLAEWEKYFARLRDHIGGASDPLLSLMLADDDLFLWYTGQLARVRKNRIDDESKARLQSVLPELPVTTRPDRITQWRRMWKKYREVYGEASERKPTARTPERQSAGLWADRQRRLRKEGKLENWKIALLEGIHFDWSRSSATLNIYARWYAKLEQLLALEAKYGKPPPVKVAKSHSLYPWMARIRGYYAKGELPPDLIRDFEAKGFEFAGMDALRERRDRKWKKNYKKVRAFHRKHGHARIPASSKEDPELGKWLHHMRERMGKGQLKPEKRQKLEELGVKPFGKRRVRKETPITPWQRNYRFLQELASNHPDGTIPDEFSLDSQIRSWITRQRKFHAKGRLQPWQIEAFRKIGINPDRAPERPRIRDEENRRRWLDNLQRMRAFVAENGHGNVPKEYSDGQLKRFIWRTRRRYRQGKLDDQQIRELREAGFVFDPSTVVTKAWMAQWAKLRAYHQKHGHSAVPRQYPPDQGLAEFVAQQKQRGRTGKLNAEHIRLLDQLDFAWSGGHPSGGRKRNA